MAAKPDIAEPEDDASFSWINIERPSDGRSKANRQRVRSYVTKLQHQRAREQQDRKRVATKRATSSNPESGTASPVSATESQSGSQHDYASKQTSFSIGRRTGGLIVFDSPAPFAGNGDLRVAEDVHTKRADAKSTDDHETTSSNDAEESNALIRQTPLPEPRSLEEMSFRTFALHDSTDSVSSSLHELRLDLSSVLGIYQSIGEIQAQDFAQQYALTKPQKGSRLFPLIFTEPVLLTTAILLGVINHLNALDRRLEGQTLVGITHLENFLIHSLNTALDDPFRRVNDQVLIAVALSAAYDIKHGSGKAFHIHMKGLVRMIEMRGGLKAIMRPDPYTARLLVWLDINTSKIAGCKAYLQDMSEEIGETLWPRANTEIFRSRGKTQSVPSSRPSSE